LNWLGSVNSTRGAIILALVILASCGGPYSARKVQSPDEKLAIADRFFDSGTYEKAAVEYKDFLATFAGDERSDYAQFKLAESYRKDEEYALAAVEYRILVSDYGYSEYIDDAFFLEGVCAFRQAGRAERDQSKSYEALSRIERFTQIFPDSPRIEEAQRIKQEIFIRLGKKHFLNGKLYYSLGRKEAALVYFDKVVTSFPGTEWTARSHYYKGLIMRERGELGGAAREIEAALRSSARFPERGDAEEVLRSLREGGSGEER
jgi:outer membrane protein assembly factor BamD